MERINKNVFKAVLLTLVLIPIIYTYLEHILSDYKLINEYKYMDEITIIDGKKFRNSEYINKYLLFKPKEVGEYKYSSKNIFFTDKNNKGLNFINSNPKYIILDLKSIHSYQDLLSIYNGQLRNIVFYKDKNMTWFEYMYRNNIFLYTEQIFEEVKKWEAVEYPVLTSNSKKELEEKFRFILANIYEQNIQIFDRYYIHENSFVLCPINSMELGKPLEQIFSQYGFLSVKLVSWIIQAKPE